MNTLQNTLPDACIFSRDAGMFYCKAGYSPKMQAYSPLMQAYPLVMRALPWCSHTLPWCRHTLKWCIGIFSRYAGILSRDVGILSRDAGIFSRDAAYSPAMHEYSPVMLAYAPVIHAYSRDAGILSWCMHPSTRATVVTVLFQSGDSSMNSDIGRSALTTYSMHSTNSETGLILQSWQLPYEGRMDIRTNHHAAWLDTIGEKNNPKRRKY